MPRKEADGELDDDTPRQDVEKKKKKKKEKRQRDENETSDITPDDAATAANGSDERPPEMGLDDSVAAEVSASRKRKSKRSREDSADAGEEAAAGTVGTDDDDETCREKQHKKQKKKKRRTECGLDGRDFTVSIALPGSILSNVPGFDQKTALAGQVARAAAVFCIDEIVVFDEAGRLPILGGQGGDGEEREAAKRQQSIDEARALAELGGDSENPSALLACLLRYAECPQYLRKRLFPRSPALGRAGLLHPLALPHHLLAEEHCQYREGVAVTSFEVDVGLTKPVRVDSLQQVGSRVTVFMGKQQRQQASKKKKNSKQHQSSNDAADSQPAKRVAPAWEPRRARGLYWGYRVRLANGLSGVLAGPCAPPAEEEEEEDNRQGKAAAAAAYDLVLGTSERGQLVDDYELPAFQRLLILFGGVQGLEHSLACDPGLAGPGGRGGVAGLCSAYLNTCPGQGSRTIRTEEALFVTLSALRPMVQRAGRR